ncbi:Mitochondrial carrier domain-containing protein [Cynara cardunculus var. scolymus]|uniref:Mitochondrial carrier domain-containing protein n=1 Tax=Cynara cardunculus var. scolymus TaxID=59895 RepID=A0A103XE24_CYNCS|nr:Mitochondrial carrier domain-containing protein [Cynara cardunculus var. scolymus]
MTSPSSDFDLGFSERAFSAAGAAFLSAIITRLQAQAAGVPYQNLYSTCRFEANPEGFARLWRGTNASLALAVPTVGIYMPCYDIFRNYMEEYSSRNAPSMTPYVPLVAAFSSFRFLWTGLGAQLSRDVPFSAVCWATLEPVRRRLLGMLGNETSPIVVLGANFTAGFVAGCLAALTMTTRQTLVEIWRDGGMKGLFTGVGPRVGRAGPSVGIVVSFYEVVKYTLQNSRHRPREKKDGVVP